MNEDDFSVIDEKSKNGGRKRGAKIRGEKNGADRSESEKDSKYRNNAGEKRDIETESGFEEIKNNKRKIKEISIEEIEEGNVDESAQVRKSVGRKRKVKVETDDDFCEEIVEEKVNKPAQVRKSVGRKKKVKAESDDDFCEEIVEEKVIKPAQVRKSVGRKRKIKAESDDDFVEENIKEKVSKSGETKVKIKKEVKSPVKSTKKVENGRKKSAKVEEEESKTWKWWEETPHPDGVNWLTLEHNGPYFAPPYEPLPADVKFYYKNKPFDLCTADEEYASFYAKMLESDYTKKEIFNKNFFEDWRNLMCEKEKSKIKHFENCNFEHMFNYYKKLHEERLALSKEEKLKIKEANEVITKKYGICTMDGHPQRVGNFRVEPPGLFRGRGDHPKQGKIKKRIYPEDVTINISKDFPVPEPPPGHEWKKIVHDRKVTWLAHWCENISNQHKYIMLNPTAKIKGVKDMAKYDIARGLRHYIDTIRESYKADLSSKELRVRQRAVAIYFIDKLALRAGHEKDEGESADTVGCCSLRVEHIKLWKDYENKKYIVDFDFLGKDSIRYVNSVAIDKKVYKNLQLFTKNKNKDEDLFDKLTTLKLNNYLSELMEGLSAKVFRTYNASSTLQDQLEALTDPDSSVDDKILSYNRANRAVAILCNHQRSIPKTFDKSMENLQEKIKKKKETIEEAEADLEQSIQDEIPETKLEAKRRKVERMKAQLYKLEISVTDKEENKQVALGTSKLNYLDPRISVAWCKSNNVPIEKIYNKAQRDKFQWAIDMTDPQFKF